MKNREYKRFIEEAMDFESEVSNFKVDFKTVTRRYGKPFIHFCIGAWIANEGRYTPEEFRSMNCNMPEGFFRMIQKKAENAGVG